MNSDNKEKSTEESVEELLTRFKLPDENDCIIENGVLIRYEGTDASLILPKKVKRIGPKAFHKNKKLIEIILHSEVSSIGKMAFYECRNLETVFTSNPATDYIHGQDSDCAEHSANTDTSVIGVQAFDKCVKLSLAVFPDNILCVEQSAFVYCEKLVTLLLPKKLVKIEKNAFSGCELLVLLKIPESVKELDENFCGFIPNKLLTFSVVPGSYADNWLRQRKWNRMYGTECCEHLAEVRNKIAPLKQLISAAAQSSFSVKSDGTVLAVGSLYDDRCIVDDWRNIVAVSACGGYTVGLQSDGTITATGAQGATAFYSWQKITAISGKTNYTVGLKSDGTVVACGNNSYGQCDVGHWRDIVAISAGWDHTLGLKKDGTVVAVGNTNYPLRLPGNRPCDVENLHHIVDIAAGCDFSVALREDGLVIPIGVTPEMKKELEKWYNIVAISAGANYVVGLKDDGTVVAAGHTGEGPCNVKHWHDIVAIYAGPAHAIGLMRNGKIESTRLSMYETGCGKQASISTWKLFEDFDNLAAEQETERQKRNQSDHWIREGLCRHCGGPLKGFLKKKCANCGQPK